MATEGFLCHVAAVCRVKSREEIKGRDESQKSELSKAELTWEGGGRGGIHLWEKREKLVPSVSLPLTVQALPHVEDLLAPSQISLSSGVSV